MQREAMGEKTCRRRTVLKTMGAAGASAVGVTAVSQPAAAGKGGDCDPETTPPALYTADHVDTTWYGSVHTTDGNSETNYDTIGEAFPDGPDELVVHCHGWDNDEECGKTRVNSAREAYDVEGYEGFVTGLVWDSSYAWWNAKDIADINGKKLANFLVDYKADNPETTLRIQGHSLGARVVAEAILELDRMGEYDVLTTAVFMVGAIENHSVAVDGRYGEAIENVVQHAENFWMEDDAILDWLFTTYEMSSAIGNDGVDGTPPANWTDHHEQLDDHSDHYQPHDGIADLVMDTFEEEKDGSNLLSDDESNVPDDVESDDDDDGFLGLFGGDGPGFTAPAVAAGIGGGALLSRYYNDSEES